MPVKVGITGGIGAGKSFVCQIIEKIGYPVYYSDKASKEIVDSDTEIKSQLINLFGSETYADNILNTDFLAGKIFNSEENRSKVNAIIHPKVRAYFEEWCKEQTAPIVFNEAAILFETGAYKNFDKMVLVSAPKELRIRRVVERDKSSEEAVLQRMEKQWTDAKKRQFANIEIINDGRPLLVQVEKMLAFVD